MRLLNTVFEIEEFKETWMTMHTPLHILKNKTANADFDEAMFYA